MTRAHCAKCRADDPAWRRLIAATFELPGAAEWFDCPFGVTTATHKPAHAKFRRRLPEFTQGAAGICLRCERQRACPSVQFCPTCGGDTIRLVAPCPDKKWGLANGN